MNTQFQTWFSEGKTVEALCGLGRYFTPDVTYRDEHDFVLAVGELLEWARQGNNDTAARAFEEATARLLGKGNLDLALRLLRSYCILRKETGFSLPLDEECITARFNQVIGESAKQLSQDERLRNLLLSVGQDYPSLTGGI